MKAVPANLLVFAANVLIPVGILVFSFGFFPYKPLIPGLATFGRSEYVPPRIFDKVIFMVVDALRSDFVFSNTSGFLFTQSLIRSGAAIPFTAYAGSPTVTMPRLKAITTGSVPSFLDVILNIAESDTSSTLAYQDTWLAQIKAKGDRLVMYGDDTWLKLFPGMFSRADGTTSFFVSVSRTLLFTQSVLPRKLTFFPQDFTEVDTNVTRHIPNELAQHDWSCLIMHYLGLDHIGHKAGPQSSFMIPKQNEMDSIVTQVYGAIEQKPHLQSTLFVLCGDHGMNDAGNHGGSSAGETSPALLFISPKLQSLGAGRDSPVDAIDELQYYRTVDQTDITPTLAGLLGLPIPLNSLGVFIPELLDMWHLGSQRIQLLNQNAKQFLRILKETHSAHSFDDSTVPSNCYAGSQSGLDEVQCAWSRAQRLLRQDDAATAHSIHVQAEIETALLHFLEVSQEVMSGAASNYDVMHLLLGTCITGLAVLFSFPDTYKALSGHRHSGLFLVACMLLYGAMMFASSYVEEEQQFWYWISTGWVFYLHVRSFESQQKAPPQAANQSTHSAAYLSHTMGVFILAISHRILRRWNQTGQKFTAEPDLARIYFPSHQGSLWFLVGLTYADVCLNLINDLTPSFIWPLLCLAVTATCFTFKLVFAASESPELLDETAVRSVAALLNGIPLVLYARVAMGGIVLLLLASRFIAKSSHSPHRRIKGNQYPDLPDSQVATQGSGNDEPNIC
ncbi:mannose-ethanolamine phosphotransferase LAS21 [Aspergillus mulundensis]|uniref:GPI ethanolamine phosphate transferase 2 n=1 Tax=Aspergillus mulundensis TaxID=1810919 RepID=A0A3D8QCE9_9EURO|nr:Uncharacterized protein DSM5745_11106 [Aspergillus mulundensis]RDW59278.1 Uncharacterized protein DSM5745_11106 [Aspergillus mulundensis]